MVTLSIHSLLSNYHICLSRLVINFSLHTLPRIYSMSAFVFIHSETSTADEFFEELVFTQKTTSDSSGCRHSIVTY